MYCKYCDKEHTRDECLKQGVYDLPSIQLIPFDIIGYFCPITKKRIEIDIIVKEEDYAFLKRI